MNKIVVLILFYFGWVNHQAVAQKVMGDSCPIKKAELFAEGIISLSTMNHSSVSFNSNLTEAYWSNFIDEETRNEIKCSYIKDGKWINPETVSFSGQYSDDVPFLSTNDSTLYFLSRRPLPGEKYTGNENIWFTRRLPGIAKWVDPEPMPKSVNQHHIHWQFSVAANGNIYFSGDDGMFMIPYNDGIYAEPCLLSATYGVSYDGVCPFISPNEDFMIFSKVIKEGFGKNDLVIGFKNEKGSWSKPVLLPSNINGKSNDLCPIFHSESNMLIYVKQQAVYNVFWINFDPENLRKL